MRHLTVGEILSLNGLLQMEANSLAISKATVGAIEDQQLKNLTQAGMTAGEARIRGLQQFITENEIVETAEVQ